MSSMHQLLTFTTIFTAQDSTTGIENGTMYVHFQGRGWISVSVGGTPSFQDVKLVFCFVFTENSKDVFSHTQPHYMEKLITHEWLESFLCKPLLILCVCFFQQFLQILYACLGTLLFSLVSTLKLKWQNMVFCNTGSISNSEIDLLKWKKHH